MKVGFTGTQHGMSDYQKEQLVVMLKILNATELHHGDCIGADAEAHEAAKRLGLVIVVHPPDKDSKRAFVTHADEWRPPLPYLVRNREIVDSTQVLIAAPMTDNMKIRSGTWATWRYARTRGKDTRILYR